MVSRSLPLTIHLRYPLPIVLPAYPLHLASLSIRLICPLSVHIVIDSTTRHGARCTLTGVQDFMNDRMQKRGVDRVRLAMRPDEAYGVIFSLDNVIVSSIVVPLRDVIVGDNIIRLHDVIV